jgi:hypothetical protein
MLAVALTAATVGDANNSRTSATTGDANKSGNMSNIQDYNTRDANCNGAGPPVTSEMGAGGRETKVGLNVVVTFRGFFCYFLPDLY